jgi:hypothetical protein
MNGLWVQYLQAPLFGTWLNGGLYRVEIVDRRLTMRMESDAGMTPGLVKPRRIRNVSFDGEFWTFVSTWEIGGFGNFRLRRVDDDLFEGSADTDGGRSIRNLWKRIDELPARVVAAAPPREWPPREAGSR